MRARRLYMRTIILIAILRSPLVSNGNLSFSRGNEDCTALIPHSAHCRIEVHCCFRRMSNLCSSAVAPSPTKLVCDDLIMYGELRIRNAESTAHTPPVWLYTFSSLIYISPPVSNCAVVCRSRKIHVGTGYCSVRTKAKH